MNKSDVDELARSAAEKVARDIITWLRFVPDVSIPDCCEQHAVDNILEALIGSDLYRAGVEAQKRSMLAETLCNCGHARRVHSFFEDHDECYECEGDEPCCEFVAALIPARAMSNPQRRIRLDLMTPAELSIRNAMLAVEEVGAHQLLTDAVNLLQQARDKVADYVDSKGEDDAIRSLIPTTIRQSGRRSK